MTSLDVRTFSNLLLPPGNKNVRFRIYTLVLGNEVCSFLCFIVLLPVGIQYFLFSLQVMAHSTPQGILDDVAMVSSCDLSDLKLSM